MQNIQQKNVNPQSDALTCSLHSEKTFLLIGNPEEELWKSSFVKKIHSAVPCKGGGQNMLDFCRYSTLLLELESLSLDFLMNSIQTGYKTLKYNIKQSRWFSN